MNVEKAQYSWHSWDDMWKAIMH